MSEHNAVMMQFFHWYTPNNGEFWNEVAGRAKELATAASTPCGSRQPRRGRTGSTMWGTAYTTYTTSVSSTRREPSAPSTVPLAYAAILLQRDGYPCLFYPDYYGAEYEDLGRDGQKHKVVLPSHRVLLDVFLRARKEYGHGEQVDYLDHWNRIGWVRLGNEEHPKAMAVLMSDDPEGTKWMSTGRPEGARFRDPTGHVADPVTVNAEGFGEFRCRGGSVSVWVQE